MVVWGCGEATRWESFDSQLRCCWFQRADHQASLEVILLRQESWCRLRLLNSGRYGSLRSLGPMAWRELRRKLLHCSSHHTLWILVLLLLLIEKLMSSLALSSFHFTIFLFFAEIARALALYHCTFGIIDVVGSITTKLIHCHRRHRWRRLEALMRLITSNSIIDYVVVCLSNGPQVRCRFRLVSRLELVQRMLLSILGAFSDRVTAHRPWYWLINDPLTRATWCPARCRLLTLTILGLWLLQLLVSKWWVWLLRQVIHSNLI